MAGDDCGNRRVNFLSDGIGNDREREFVSSIDSCTIGGCAQMRDDEKTEKTRATDTLRFRVGRNSASPEVIRAATGHGKIRKTSHGRHVPVAHVRFGAEITKDGRAAEKMIFAKARLAENGVGSRRGGETGSSAV